MITKRQILSLVFSAFASLATYAQDTELPALHVDGKWLANPEGDHVVLHGVMDTPNMYFNGWRWGSPWTGTNYDNSGAKKCLDYFEKIFAGLEKANCDVFRLHLDPAWTNDPSDGYTYEGANDQPEDAKEEADIKKFNPDRLTSFLSKLYIPLMKKAMNHGLYVVVRPPGVCPQNLKVGDYYQQYLTTVWDIVSKDETIQTHAGQISLELANEPVKLKDKNGNDNTSALHDYFQPIVDKIRDNGFTGIIWIPGTGWQSNYTSYKTKPITGDNIGYAVHDYTGWYGCSDDNPDPLNKINTFHNQVPVVDTNPIIITEVDWSPENPDAEGHYDEHGNWVLPNYGTWSTGSTSKWGKAYKAMLDHFGNISMTLSGTGCLIDVDELINNNKVTPAFGGLEEACGKACMDWYAQYKGLSVIEGFGEEITSLDYITAGNRFLIGDGTNALYFEVSQNALSTPVTELPLDFYYYYTLTKIDGYDNVYAVNITDKFGTPFPAPYSLGSNLNASIYNIVFSGSAKADKYGTDGQNYGIWQITYTDDKGFAFRNIGTDKYMSMTDLSDEAVYMRLYKGVKMAGEESADDQIFALSKAKGYDAATGMMTGGWVFDDPVDISRWDYLMIMTSVTAADESHSIVITDANGKTVRGEDYKGSEAGTGGNLWFDYWNNQNAIRIDINYLKDNLGVDVTHIKALEFKGWGDSYASVGVSTVYLTRYNNAKVKGGYATGDIVREYAAPGRLGTICLPYKAAVAGAKVYSVACTVDGGIGLQPVDGLLEAGKPYFYMAVDKIGKNNEAEVCNVNFFRADLEDYDVVVPIESNGLIGTFIDTTAPQGDDIYVLNNNKLYYTTGASVNVAAGKAYLDMSKVKNVAEARITLGIDEATGIHQVENGALRVGNGTSTAAHYFNLQGQRVTQPAKGIYIVNGKKIVKH